VDETHGRKQTVFKGILSSRVAAVSAGAVLVVGLGAGGAMAGQMIDSGDIRNQSITGRDIKRNGVGASEIRPGSVRWWHLDDGTMGSGAKGEPGEDGVSGYHVFTSVQDFGPGGIGGAWCGAPDANTEDQHWRVVGGGAKLTPEDVDAGVAVVSSWPNLADPLNPGWNVQLNKPTNVNPGDVELFAVCVKVAEDLAD
jgi:hypothetical protein